jgi:hypothetical protein
MEFSIAGDPFLLLRVTICQKKLPFVRLCHGKKCRDVKVTVPEKT